MSFGHSSRRSSFQGSDNRQVAGLPVIANRLRLTGPTGSPGSIDVSTNSCPSRALELSDAAKSASASKDVMAESIEPVSFRQETMRATTLPEPELSQPPICPTAALDAHVRTIKAEEIPSHALLETGSKLFWRINCTVEFKVYLSEAAVVVRAFDNTNDVEFKPLILDLRIISAQVHFFRDKGNIHVT